MHNLSLCLLAIGLSICCSYGQGQIEKLPPSVNTDAYDESAPVLSKDGKMLFFTRTAYPDFEASLMDEDGQVVSNKGDEDYESKLADIYSQIAGRPVADPYTSEFNQDIWMTSIVEDSIRNVQHPGFPLNNALPNSLVSAGMTPDEYVIINQFYEDGSMYGGFSRVTIKEDGTHTFPQPMHVYGFNISSSDVNLTMSPGGHVIIMSLHRADAIGYNDLYVSFYMRPNVWSAPEHMGTVINSAFQETTPHISPDKRFLYFSSNRPGGPGGNDIYVSERLDYTWHHWSEPVLLKGDVNSAFDDSQPSFTRGNNYMYFTSRRDGSSDIFRMRLTEMPRLKNPIFIRGKIVNSETGKPIRSELVWGPSSSKDFLEYFSSYNGDFEALLTEYEPYKFLPRKLGFTAKRIMVDPRLIEKEGKDTIELTLYLDPRTGDIVAEGSEGYPMHLSKNSPAQPGSSQSGKGASDPPKAKDIFVYDINFVKGKAAILTKSVQALQDLLSLMRRNPAMEILVEGHTDNVGDEVALINLSEERADAIRDYLVANGIDTARIRIRGMGATKPIHQNETESGREKNRRVEITVTKI